MAKTKKTATINEPRTARAIDHAVLPVESLAVARDRMSALGFTVAPDGVHPFGTENACVYFADGTFLEPLAIAQREDCEATALEGNVFTARDQAFRFRCGENGFSALAFATDDAKRDHKAFEKSGFSAGDRLKFKRKFRDADGKSDKAEFMLAFAADMRSPDAFFFTCERVAQPNVDRSTLEAHENGVTGIREVILSEINPTDFQYVLQEAVDNRTDEAHSFGLEIAAANGALNTMTPEGLQAWFGAKRSGAGRGLRFEGLILTTRLLSTVRRLLDERGIAHRELHNRIVVDAAPGQGCFIAFQEDASA